MLVQEVLLALLGHTGDVCIRQYDRHQHSYSDVDDFHSLRAVVVDDSLSFIDASDRAAIDHQLTLAYHFIRIRAFTNIHHSDSQYRQSTALAVGQLLDAYHSTVVHCQQRLVNDNDSGNDSGLSFLSHTLFPFHTLLPSLSQSLSLVVADSAMVGGRLLSLLHRQSHTGFVLLKSMYDEMLQSSSSLFYQQCLAWVTQARLIDRHHEFFITTDSDDTEDSQAYYLRLSMKPDYLPLTLAQTILFIGQAVMIVNNQRRNNRTSPSLSLSAPFLSFQASVAAFRSQQKFSLHSFESLFEPLHRYVTDQLSTVLLSSTFFDCVKLLQSFYLCSDQEFYHTLLTLTTTNTNSHALSENELQSLFNEALKVTDSSNDSDDGSGSGGSGMTAKFIIKPKLEVSKFQYDSFSNQQLKRRRSSGSASGEDARMLTSVHSAKVLNDRPSIALTSHSSNDRGALFYTRRQYLADGFSTYFTFNTNRATNNDSEIGSGSGSKSGFCFIIHSNNLSSVNSGHFHYQTKNHVPTFAGVPSSLMIELIHHRSNGKDREQVIVYSANAQASAQCLATIQLTSHWTVFDGRTHTVTIDYRTHAHTDSSSDRDSDSGVLTVTLNNASTPIISLPLDLSSIISLDNGRAFVGFLSATPPPSQSSVPASDDRHRVVVIQSWHFHESPVTSSAPLVLTHNHWSRRLYFVISIPPLLSLLVPPALVDDYHSLFAFLFTIKHCYHSLRQCSLTLLKSHRPNKASEKFLFYVHSIIQFFVHSLHDHLFADILFPLSQAFMKSISSETNYLLVLERHSRYVNSLSVAMYRREKVLQSLVQTLVQRTYQFINIATRAHTDTDAESGSGSLLSLYSEYERSLVLLYTVLNRKSSFQSSQSVSQLLARLDSNHWLSRLTLSAKLKTLNEKQSIRRASLMSGLTMTGSPDGGRGPSVTRLAERRASVPDVRS